MTKEKKLWLNQTISVIEKLLDANRCSDCFTSWDIETLEELSKLSRQGVLDDFYENSLRFRTLCNELSEFVQTLKNMIKYSEMSESYE